tara:strand:+ start:25 stop:240 length:216 start_codon:yes stop_codon:yes gene_type:complete
MQAQREIPVEEEEDDPPISEYEINELEQLLKKKQRIYLSKTDSKGRGGGGGGCCKYDIIYENNLYKTGLII